jgi:hypothetical protein
MAKEPEQAAKSETEGEDAAAEQQPKSEEAER